VSPRPDFSLEGRVAIITGGAGLLGIRHAEAIASAGGIPVLADVRGAEATTRAEEVARTFGSAAAGFACDVTSASSVERLLQDTVARFGRIDILVNNAANNPKVEAPGEAFSRFENFPAEQWSADLAVGLTGPFLCAKIVGAAMAGQGHGVIINISSEYGVIAPDQRLYEREGLPSDKQPVKPVTYTVVKAGLHGLTIYLATYWALAGVRVNTITLGGVESGQPAGFLAKATAKIPMGRMARPHDFQGALVYLCSDAAAFVTGANLVVDGGKTIW
jgi:NAD(P)-dependent dehydrogenase (short-subunit alcohol dehydrogenase family)